jgi:hypothetical protein
LTKFNHDFINNDFKQTCCNYFNLEFSYFLEFFESVKIIFDTILNICQNGFVKSFADIVKNYLKKYFMVYEKDAGYDYITTNIPFDYIIEQVDKIITVLQLANDNNFKTDFVIYIIKNIHEREENIYIIKYEKFNEIDYKKIYYKNIHKFFNSLAKQIVNKYISKTLFDIFEEDSLEFAKLAFTNLKEIFNSQSNANNEEFFDSFVNSFEKFTAVLNKYDQRINWRELKIALSALERYNGFYLG